MVFCGCFKYKYGYNKRYGLVYVNREDKEIKDLRRVKKDSFYWYKKVIESNGASIFD